MSQGVHVIFGAGPVGLALMDELLTRDKQVRLINRSGVADVPADVEVVGGNAADPAFATEAARGATVIYQCLNPPYDQWVEQFPSLQRSVIAAASATEAKLVTLENCYMYGPPGGRHLTETVPHAPTTRKGTVRAQMSEELMAAHDRGQVRVAVGRASDYFGPRGGRQSQLGDRVIPAALQGGTARVLGDPQMPHTYTFLPDIAMGLAMLGEHEVALGEIWHLPNPDTRTTRQVVDMAFEEAGHSTRLRPTSSLQLRMIAPFRREVKELIEMMYQFTEPFIVSSTKFEDTFGVRGTKLREAIRRTVEWYRLHPGGRSSP